MKRFMITRRNFLQGLLGSFALMGMPGLSFANANTDMRLAVIILRGGMDGLATAIPYGDPNYQSIRGRMAAETDGLMRMNDMFGLNPILDQFQNMYNKDELLVLHAIASPYRDRSHFDAQNILEIGGTKPHEMKSGWLNRLAAAIDNKNNRLGISIGAGMPLIMQGQQPVGSWAPSTLPEASENYFMLAQKIYSKDAALSKALNEGLAIEEQANMLFHDKKDRDMTRKSVSRNNFPILAEATGKFLGDLNGPKLAVVEMGGWDTHIDGVDGRTTGGQVTLNLTRFNEGIELLREGLGDTWKKTVVVTMTEFGRTVKPNGSGGTDHGTASAAFVFGGAVKGGRVITNWPGIGEKDLYEGRDLKPTLDLRAMMKGIIYDMYGLPDAALNADIFPGSQNVERIKGLVKV